MTNNSSPSFGSTIGNPSPVGLAAFGTTTFYLMTINMGWSEPSFVDLVACNAIYYGGICQLLVGVFELIKGSSFSFLVFSSYGAFWLGFAKLTLETSYTVNQIGNDGPFPIGMSLYYFQWTILTAFFTFVATRKNRALMLLFGLLTITFGLLSIATGLSVNESTNSASGIVTKIAGYFGWATAMQAYYTCFAEIINEEWGRHVLPGLKPIVNSNAPSNIIGNNPKAFAKKHMEYDSKTNTLMLYFRSLQILSNENVDIICKAIEHKVISCTNGEKASNSIEDESSISKVNVIVDYKDAVIGTDIYEDYIEKLNELQKKYYLSCIRFGISSFGTQTNEADFIMKTKLG